MNKESETRRSERTYLGRSEMCGRPCGNNSGGIRVYLPSRKSPSAEKQGGPGGIDRRRKAQPAGHRAGQPVEDDWAHAPPGYLPYKGSWPAYWPLTLAAHCRRGSIAS